jgi:hypothetical protein
MANLSRKNFIEKASVSVATVGMVATVPGFTVSRGTAHASAQGGEAVAQSGPILAHVRNVATGEIAILFGSQEVIIHDRAMALRIVQAAL